MNKKIIFTILYCTLYSILNVAGAALIKNKLNGRQLNEFKEWFNFLINPQIIIAFIIIFSASLVMFKALSYGSFSLTIPIATGINFILTFAVGYFIFNDNLNIVSFLGFVLILSGIFLLSLNSHQHAQ